jgi:cation diffusion facilitator family transporter
LLIIALLVVYEAISKFMNPVVPTVSNASLIALVLTLVVNIFVCTYEYRQGVALRSPILISDSQHTRSDVYVSISVLGTLIGIKLGAPPIIDPIASLLVAAFIIRAAVEIIKSTSEVLVDKAVADTAAIEELVLGFAQVRGVHDIRSRGSEQQLYIDMHILVDMDMGVAAAHQLSHEIEGRIQQLLQHPSRVMIHTEPFRNTGENRNALGV